METQRAEDLKASRQALLLERRAMRNQSVVTRQVTAALSPPPAAAPCTAISLATISAAPAPTPAPHFAAHAAFAGRYCPVHRDAPRSLRPPSHSQALVDKIDKMRQSNSFYLPPSMRSQIENPELIELMERCDEMGAEMGGGKVTMAMMKHILQQMQSEGKLQEMLPGHKRGGSSTALVRPATAPTQVGGGDLSPL